VVTRSAQRLGIQRTEEAGAAKYIFNNLLRAVFGFSGVVI